MKTTETVYKCDGVPGDRDGGCGKVVAYGAGVIVRGEIVAGPDAANATGSVLVAGTPSGETVLCFDCLRRRLRMREPEPRVVERVVEVPKFIESPSYHGDYKTPGQGPTGPMSPPDLPRCVEVVAALARAR